MGATIDEAADQSALPPSATPARFTVTACGRTDVGRVRKNNEDAFLVASLGSAPEGAPSAGVATFDATEHPLLLAVSDGMGGAQAGEIASALVVESLRRAMTSAQGDWDEAIRLAVERSNAEVWHAAREPGRRGMGATLAAACIHRDCAHIAAVGDSRAYLVRSRRIRQITRDQSYVQALLDAGAIRPEEVDQYPMKNVVLQAMGQGPDVRVAVGRLDLRRGDRLLLCSDGLSNMVSDEEMRGALEGGATLDAVCAGLVEIANERGGEDNITVVVAEVDGEGLPPPKGIETVTQTLHVVTEYSPARPGGEDRQRSMTEPSNMKPGAAGTEEPSPPAPADGQSKFEKTAGKNVSLIGEVVGFLSQNKKWWLLPIMGTLLVIGLLVLLSTTAAAPFIYTFF